jgi:hypothetical protein
MEFDNDDWLTRVGAVTFTSAATTLGYSLDTLIHFINSTSLLKLI